MVTRMMGTTGMMRMRMLVMIMMTMMTMPMMNIMVDNSETLLDGYMQTKPSLYAANQSLRT